MQANRGFALAATMMVLALISVLGAMAIQSATLEVQISAHDRDARAALYVAEAALDEARYYVSRGWGKLTPDPFIPPQAQLDLTVDTPFPPGFAWVDHQYAGFTLVDAAGSRFPVIDNSANVITTDTSAIPAGGTGPAAGRFTLVREGITGSWSGGPPSELTVTDAVWAAASGPGTWTGWTLWDDATPPNGYQVTGSTTPVANEVVLTVPNLPAAAALGALSLGTHPWLSALVAGSVPGGDADAGNGPLWDRIYQNAGGTEIGRGAVGAAPVPGTPGSYTMTSQGGVGGRRSTVQLTVFHAGAPIQATGDWSIDDG